MIICILGHFMSLIKELGVCDTCARTDVIDPIICGDICGRRHVK